MNKTAKQSPMYERLLERYLKGYITESQLDRYVALNQLTAEEAEKIRFEKEAQEIGDRPTILPEQ